MSVHTLFAGLGSRPTEDVFPIKRVLVQASPAAAALLAKDGEEDVSVLGRRAVRVACRALEAVRGALDPAAQRSSDTGGVLACTVTRTGAQVELREFRATLSYTEARWRLVLDKRGPDGREKEHRAE